MTGVGGMSDAVDHPQHYGGADNPYVLQDLRKARWYLDREISNREKQHGKD